MAEEVPQVPQVHGLQHVHALDELIQAHVVLGPSAQALGGRAGHQDQLRLAAVHAQHAQGLPEEHGAVDAQRAVGAEEPLLFPHISSSKAPFKGSQEARLGAACLAESLKAQPFHAHLQGRQDVGRQPLVAAREVDILRVLRILGTHILFSKQPCGKHVEGELDVGMLHQVLIP